MDYKKFIDELLKNLVDQDASDLHLGAGRKPAMRVNGQLLFLVNSNVLTNEDMIGILNFILGESRTQKFLIFEEDLILQLFLFLVVI